MKTILIKKITAIAMLSAGILTVDMIPSIAQNTSGQGNSSNTNANSQNAKQSRTNQGAASGQKMQGKSMSSASMDATFIRKASEGNLAEVDLGNMALQKASSQEVKDFAQQVIDHHSKANEKLVGIVSGSANMSSNSTRDQRIPSTDDNSGNAGMATNKKRSSVGSNNASDDANMNDNSEQTTTNSSSISSPTNDNTVDGNNQGNTRSADPERNISDGTGGGGAGANSGGTTSSTSTNRVGGTEMNEGATDNTGASQHNTNTSDQTGLQGDSGNLRKGTGGSSSMYGTSDAGNGGFDNPIATTLSAEHVAVKKRLSGLSGAEFDREYMMAMVKDHAKTIELFEMQIQKGQNTELVNFAKNGLPMIREHHQKAQALSGSKGNMNKGSSTNKGSSGSK